jgi:D-amino-acid oxidase
MTKSVAIIGAGVSGLTCGVVFAERGYRATIFAEETGADTTSAAAAAIWYPYDAEPVERVIAWALESYEVFRELSRDARSGVSMIELRTFSRTGEIEIPSWAISLGARRLVMSSEYDSPPRTETFPIVHPTAFMSGFVMTVPVIDTTFYLDYLEQRFAHADGRITSNVHFESLQDVDGEFPLIINCSGVGAKSLVSDRDLEPHRGQVVVVSKFDLPYAVVSDDAPLMYAIPRNNDCVFGGTNELSDDRTPDSSATSAILAECCRVLNVKEPKIIAERVGLRPFRKSGVRVERDRSRDDRLVIHNYGHGGAGFTVSWGCAAKALALASDNT